MTLQELVPAQLNTTDKIAPPGPPKLPFVGMLTFISKYSHRKYFQLAKKYGNLFQIRVGSKTLFVLNGLETIRSALVNQQDIFNARANLDVYQKYPQRYFMEMKSGESWERHRDISGEVMKTFMSGKSEMFDSWITEEAADLVNVFVNLSGKPFAPELYLALANLNFIQRLIFNKKGSLNDPKEYSDFVAAAGGLNKLNKGAVTLPKLEVISAIWRPILAISRLKPILGFYLSAPALDHFVIKNIEQHRESLKPDNLRDITDGLLQASTELTESDREKLGLSEADIVNGTLFQFAGAGGGLPSLMLNWALLYMITYPEIQAEVQKELDEVVGAEQPSFKYRSKLPFTEACIHEIFRHSGATVIPAVLYAPNDDTTLDGYFIPKGTPLIINYYSLTRDQKYWEEPEKFNPYRFLDENGKIRQNLVDQFYPFGVGSRRCIGEYLGRLQIFVLFANLMHRCKFEKAPGKRLNPDPSLNPQYSIIMSPPDYKVVTKPRF
ncbi:MAG: cytochrome P450 [Calothrix sp. MO_167.B42]|nr:cytochrome P450 [Calothrix sp. MO_167.B42]